MFGNKQRTIEALQGQVFTLEQDVARKDNLLTGAKEMLETSQEHITGYEGTIETLESENERQATINQALAEENRDLARKLELYRAIFRQLNIDVKFPARAK